LTAPPGNESSTTPSWLAQRFRCPDCHSPALQVVQAAFVCNQCKTEFPLVRGIPVLIRTDNDVFPRSAYLEAMPGAPAPTLRLFRRLLPARSVNITYRSNLRLFAAALRDTAAQSVLVIGAGSQRRWLETLFSSHPSIRVAYSDVDVRGDVDVFCDAHNLPFGNEAFDGVIASAVLEHVLYPENAVAEIHRVLARNGLVYTEVPFLQQVHEGAYDFTRYTLSGHRRLFNHFEDVRSGVVAGPATTLAWAIEHFAICCAPRRLAPAIRLAVRMAFFWLKYFDYVFGQSPAAADGASCTFFFGRKSTSVRPDVDIIERYMGVKRVRHV
jgi:SAM-dependent methyltransferase